jgi:hypothetical protein
LVHQGADQVASCLLLVQLFKGEQLLRLELVQCLINARPFDYVALSVVACLVVVKVDRLALPPIFIVQVPNPVGKWAFLT